MKRIVGSVLALSLQACGGAFAAGQDDHDRDPHRQRKNQRDDHGPQQARHPDRHDDPRRHQRGKRLAVSERSDHMPDYRRHGLKAPPRGHEWRRIDDPYVPIAVATELITSAIAHSR
ncbi:RcnB family protein [Xanthomonas theicola]|uniref:RcnB family protein n=1 Tax=Xanthomonas theicola TaxID=56464 RepID=A0A2S6ZK20_9XANT|nr:RcnB family protein [Xanthomonas theicola]PPT92529.1 hypothetical protein XthCFBP4691_03325 [Xanthomonas theicola]QNH25502.1 hypothetical protein G4Q83_13120 [Xanthomonas theicola]